MRGSKPLPNSHIHHSSISLQQSPTPRTNNTTHLTPNNPSISKPTTAKKSTPSNSNHKSQAIKHVHNNSDNNSFGPHNSLGDAEGNVTLDSITESAIGEMDEAVRVHVANANAEATTSIDSTNTQFLNQVQEMAEGHMPRQSNRRDRRLNKKQMKHMQDAQGESSQSSGETLVEDTLNSREESTWADHNGSPRSVDEEEQEPAPNVHYHSDGGSKWNNAQHSSKYWPLHKSSMQLRERPKPNASK